MTSSIESIQLKASDELLICDQIIRRIPGKRTVFFGRWGDKRVVAKLFYGSRNAKRQAAREREGVMALQEARIPTPLFYGQYTTDDQRAEVLLFERIENAVNVDERWQAQKDVIALRPLLHALIIELATQHVLGIKQRDLHLKNFLIDEGKIYTLDGSDIEKKEDRLEKTESIKHLALLIAQLGSQASFCQMELFTVYAKARGWRLKDSDHERLQAQINYYQAYRWAKFQKKIRRSCSAFRKLQSPTHLTMVDRQYENNLFNNFLAEPEKLFSSPHIQVLKKGNTSTVIKATIKGRTFVIKRYNVKSFWHGLRRCLRPTRAARAWCLAQCLCLMGIPTAKPVAFIEKRWWGLRRESYFVMEYQEAVHLGHYYLQPNLQENDKKAMADKVIQLLNQLALFQVTHGDLKMTNILVHQHQPFLIDLDGARKHRSAKRFKRAFYQEWQRFLENWKDQPSIFKWFRGR